MLNGGDIHFYRNHSFFLFKFFLLIDDNHYDDILTLILVFDGFALLYFMQYY